MQNDEGRRKPWNGSILEHCNVGERTGLDTLMLIVLRLKSLSLASINLLLFNHCCIACLLKSYSNNEHLAALNYS